MALYLTEDDVMGVLTMDLALEAVEDAFGLLAEGKATNSPRSRTRLPTGVFNLMSAAAPGLGVMGLKAYAAFRGSPVRFYVQLSSTETGELLAIMEASGLGRVRTGAASGVATKHMARPEASSVGVLGSGFQARSQLEAVCRVRPVRDVRVYSPTPEHRTRFAAEMGSLLAVRAVAVDTAEECVRESDIVITMTNASRPVLEGEWLTPGVHVNAAGANHWMRQELDVGAVARADVAVVDDVEQAKLECGDIIYAVEQGMARWEQVHGLAEVVAGRAPGRTGGADVTLFESQGLALEDVATALRVYRLARDRGIGRELPI